MSEQDIRPQEESETTNKRLKDISDQLSWVLVFLFVIMLSECSRR